MGTPGDKAEIGKVVQEGQQLDPHSIESESVRQAAAGVLEAPPPPPPPPPDISQTTTATDIEMGVISRTTHFETFSPHHHHQQQSLSTTTPTGIITTKPESFLEQAHIEDYFAQSKYYPGPVPDPAALFHHPLPPDDEGDDDDIPPQPGPSGLQATARGKSAAKVGVKRGKKAAGHVQSQQQQQPHLKRIQCQVCQKNFSTADKLSKHQLIHAASSPFKCEHCKKSFTSKFKLVRHALIHSDRKPFSCTVCERTFHRKDHLKNHIKVHSPSKKVFMCEKTDCKKEYTSMISYRKHLALHAAEEGSLQCQICSSEFATKEEILYHLKIHAGSRTVKNPNEKKFTCDQCDRKFFTKKDVRRHMVVHTGMRDFLCQFCPQRFGRKDHLVRHIKKSHSKNVPPEDLETAIALPETITRPPKETIKTEVKVEELGESSLSNPEQFDFPFDEYLEDEDFTPFLEPDTFLPQASTSAEQCKIEEDEDALKDFDSTILEDIVGEGLNVVAGVEEEEEILGLNPDLQRLLEPSEEKNLPLPGFSQTFQPPPPP